jgi:hypothetical protein
MAADAGSAATRSQGSASEDEAEQEPESDAEPACGEKSQGYCAESWRGLPAAIAKINVRWRMVDDDLSPCVQCSILLRKGSAQSDEMK